METVKTNRWCRLRGVFVFLLFVCCLMLVFSDQYNKSSTMDVFKEILNEASCYHILNDAFLPQTDNPWFVVEGCELHNYSTSDTQACMFKISQQYGVNNIYMIGDSKIRKLYVALTRLLGSAVYIPRERRHNDSRFQSEGKPTKVTYKFRGKMDRQVLRDYISLGKLPVSSRPRVILTNSALWDLGYSGTFNQSSRCFKGNLSALIPHMTKLTKTTDIIWMLQDPPNLDPEWMKEPKSNPRGPDKIDAFNKYAIDLLSATPVKVWHTARKASQRFPEGFQDGFHVSDEVLDYKAQLFINWYCNRHMNFTDGTCCNAQIVPRTHPKLLTAQQLVVYTSTAILLLCTVLALLYRAF